MAPDRGGAPSDSRAGERMHGRPARLPVCHLSHLSGCTPFLRAPPAFPFAVLLSPSLARTLWLLEGQLATKTSLDRSSHQVGRSQSESEACKMAVSIMDRGEGTWTRKRVTGWSSCPEAKGNVQNVFAENSELANIAALTRIPAPRWGHRGTGSQRGGVTWRRPWWIAVFQILPQRLSSRGLEVDTAKLSPRPSSQWPLDPATMPLLQQWSISPNRVVLVPSSRRHHHLRLNTVEASRAFCTLPSDPSKREAIF